MELDKNYCLHPNYKSKEEITFQDTSNKKDEYQDDVYKYVLDVITATYLPKKCKIIDFGCGSGYKLKKWFSYLNCEITGYDLKETVSILKKKYPNGNWLVSDFSINPISSDLLICADVIEHVLNPDELMLWIQKSSCSDIIISTPNRDLLVEKLGRSNNGVPDNPYHVREWSYDEFKKYVSQFLKIENHFTIDKEYNQVIHCKPL